MHSNGIFVRLYRFITPAIAGALYKAHYFYFLVWEYDNQYDRRDGFQ